MIDTIKQPGVITAEEIKAMYDYMLMTIPEFKKFVEDNKHLSNKEFMSKYGLNELSSI